MSRCPTPSPKLAATNAPSLQASSTSAQTCLRPSTPGSAARMRRHSAANCSNDKLISLPPALAASIGVAALALERDAEMIAQRLDRLAFGGIGVGIVGADDDAAERRIGLAARRQHRRDMAVAVGVAQRHEERHFLLDMRVEADLLLEECPRHRLIGLRGLLALEAEMLLDRVAHELGFARRLDLGFEPEPALAIGCIDDKAHLSRSLPDAPEDPESTPEGKPMKRCAC